MSTSANSSSASAPSFAELEHTNPMWVCPFFLEQCGFKNKVKEIMKKGGWPEFLTLTCEDDVADSTEFLETFRDYPDANQPYFTYAFRQRILKTTYKEFRKAMKWPSNGEFRDGGMETEYQLWQALTGTTKSFYPSRSKASEIKDPVMFYLKFMLARTLFARDNGKNKVKRLELGLLSLLQERKKVDWAAYFIEHVKNLGKDGVVTVGGMVTLVLRRLHPQFTSEGAVLVKPWQYATHVEFESGRNIRYTRSGELQWIYFADESLQPPRSPKAKRGRPKKKRGVDESSGSGSMAVVSTGMDAHAEQQTGGMNQGVVDDIFHNTRCYMFGALNITRLPAPAGWKPGDAIPPEYMGPHGGL